MAKGWVWDGKIRKKLATLVSKKSSEINKTHLRVKIFRGRGRLKYAIKIDTHVGSRANRLLSMLNKYRCT